MNLDSYIDKLNHPVMGKFEDSKNSSYKDWMIQRKWDGFRCLLDTRCHVKVSRHLLNDHGSYKDMQFPDIVEAIHKNIVVKNCILDGEMIVLEGDDINDFPNLMSRQATKDRLKIKLLRMKYPATYVAFDILEYEGDDCRELPLEDRMKLLAKVVKTCKEIRMITDFGIDTPPRLKERCINNNYEGVVLKPRGQNYFAETVKLKAWQEEEFKITNVDSTGSRLISTIEVDCENPTNVKYNGEQTVARRDSLIGKIAEIRFLNPVKAGGKLRFPSLLRIK